MWASVVAVAASIGTTHTVTRIGSSGLDVEVECLDPLSLCAPNELMLLSEMECSAFAGRRTASSPRVNALMVCGPGTFKPEGDGDRSIPLSMIAGEAGATLVYNRCWPWLRRSRLIPSRAFTAEPCSVSLDAGMGRLSTAREDRNETW